MSARRKDDFYVTPYDLALSICKRAAREIPTNAQFPQPQRIIDAGAGSGVFCRAARAVWPGAKIVAIEKNPEHEAACREAGADKFVCANFLTVAAQAISEADLVLGNPPFSRAEGFVTHAWKSMKPDAAICFLLANSFRASVGRWAPGGLFAFAPWLHSWPVVPRPGFTGDGKTERTEYEVMLWRIGLTQGGVEPIHWTKGGTP